MQKGMEALDVACGPGYTVQEIYQRSAIPTGLDFSAAMIAKAHREYPHLRFIEGDAHELAFPDGTFHRVVMNFG
jgi:ubiquinone/menaquinone biosynthesis C-methylase UbiE